MPKEKKNAFKYRQAADPLAPPHARSNDPLAEPKDIAPIFQEINNGTDVQRENSCYILATLILEDSAREHYLKNGVIKQLTNRLADPSVHVRSAALGALRNLSLSGGHQVCQQMVDDDCLFPLISILLKVLPLIDSTQSETNSEIINFTVQAVSILWNLSESSDKATEYITNSNILVPLLQLLSPKKYTRDLVRSVANFFLVISEDNANCLKQIKSDESLRYLESIIADETLDIELRVLASGIYYNFLHGTDKQEDAIKSLYPFLLSALDNFHPSSLNQIDPLITATKELEKRIEEEMQKRKGEELDADEVEARNQLAADEKKCEDYLNTWRLRTSAQAISLEILTNFCSVTQDEEIVSMESGAEEMEEIEAEEELPEVIPDPGTHDEIDLPPFLVQTFLSRPIIPRLIELACSGIGEIQAKHPDQIAPVSDVSRRVQLRSLSFLNNLLLALPLAGPNN
eukprot:TRINITY_DN943_c0_g1_i2.p1 TRINITY_DN943_c0_g1~~TRINITY_DN943_c0_g1_i2.p1  ORF type:complete len:459 (-),score=100.05 TRINITY_DN943_c0_g1_i2:689-2065(-)